MSTGTTSDRGYPYPNNDEPVTNGWDAIRDLAEAVDNDVKDTREAPYARATGGDYGTINGGTTHTISNLADAEEAGGLTHAAGVFTVPEAGVYLVTAQFQETPITAPHNGTSYWFGINGTAGRAPNAYAGDGHIGNNMWLALTEVIRLAAGDTVRLCGQGIGGQTGHRYTVMSVIKLRD